MRATTSHRAVLAAALFITVLAAVLVLGAPEALADTLAEPPKDLNTMINRITRWLVGLLAALATLFLTVGGVRYLLAGGDPGEVAKAKDTLKYAAIGYGVAVLAPLLVNILKGFVGGG